MIKLTKDEFIANLIGYKSYILKNKLDLNIIKRLRPPFFASYKSPKKIIIPKKNNKFTIKKNSLLVNFERKYKKNYPVYIDCRESKKKDLPQLKNITYEDSSNSRFTRDPLIPKKFKKGYRKEWLLNFFKRKRGDHLIVAYKRNIIMGFILIIKKSLDSSYQIDLIVTAKKHQKKKVGTSLINYVNNYHMTKGEKIIAGTQADNLKAIKMYKKLGFIKTKKVLYVYHVHHNKNNLAKYD